MSRKHFIALAEAIAELDNTAERVRMAELVGAVCADQNGHFDWTRWRAACGAK
jgi:hypothetical protein